MGLDCPRTNIMCKLDVYVHGVSEITIMACCLSTIWRFEWAELDYYSVLHFRCESQNGDVCPGYCLYPADAGHAAWSGQSVRPDPEYFVLANLSSCTVTVLSSTNRVGEQHWNGHSKGNIHWIDCKHGTCRCIHNVTPLMWLTSVGAPHSIMSH